jgi:hypothetical protein
MVSPGDRLGFMNEMDVSSIAHQFVPNGINIPFYNLENQTQPVLNTVITFDPFSLPYSFAIAAVYDTGALLHLCQKCQSFILLLQMRNITMTTASRAALATACPQNPPPPPPSSPQQRPLTSEDPKDRKGPR